MRTSPYLMVLEVEVLDAHLTDEVCPDCSSEVARVSYVITRRMRGSSRTEVVQSNDVLACADEELCGWSTQYVPVPR